MERLSALPPADLAVIVVTWNVREIVLAALRTLIADLKTTDLNWQVFVVDNASADGTAAAIRAAAFERLTLIESGANLGFGAGNNLALRALGFSDAPGRAPNAPRAVFLLNPDTLVHQGAVAALHQALFSLPYAGLVGPRLSYADGSLQHSAFRFPGLTQIAIDLLPLPAALHGRLYESALNGRYPRRRYAADQPPFVVEHTLGAAMMLHREAIEAAGLFDEGYFMYAEELDWSMRIRRAGWEIYLVPSAHITHLEGQSARQVRPQSVVNLWRSRLRFYRKFYTPLRAWLAAQLIRVGMRFQIGKARRLAAQGAISAADCAALIAAYREVMRL
ncbi:MAG: glycosyltransferase family 2 protein [Candidatus Thermofonsia Clade 1 bacterium]|jgi:GT2 family glycosyltransferase|uniref:Glycosyltransferase family 2 protein n=1 Tax=Candidatus Thermofonsia Clade 1 bacterium TaxID=2364210 RepID=A0A2M8PAH1_9CHLR|nr:MAG: glycosyltransferase family 2 protein [Candidatus Thermofonsia Clade 1 bacterium]